MVNFGHQAHAFSNADRFRYWLRSILARVDDQKLFHALTRWRDRTRKKTNILAKCVEFAASSKAKVYYFKECVRRVLQVNTYIKSGLS